jgi:hypothetical protein
VLPTSGATLRWPSKLPTLPENLNWGMLATMPVWDSASMPPGEGLDAIKATYSMEVCQQPWVAPGVRGGAHGAADDVPAPLPPTRLERATTNVTVIVRRIRGCDTSQHFTDDPATVSQQS